MFKYNILLLIINISTFLYLVELNFGISSECQHRDYHQGSTVCVCTEAHCDNFEPLKKKPHGIIQVYETSRSGNRFRYSQLHFFNETLNHEEDSHEIQIHLDRKRRYQKIIGFGGAFTDAAGINIGKLSKKLQNRLIRDYFNSDGIEYTIGRIPIGGSDFSTRPYTYDDNPEDESLSKFSLQMEDIHYKIPYLKMAQKVSPHKVRFLGSPWSAPAWMKTNNNIRYGGFLKGQPGGKYYKLYATYLVKFLEEYQKHNVSMYGITIENEPTSGYDPKWRFNCMGFNSTLERDFIKLDLGPKLYLNGFTKDKLAVLIYDDQIPGMKAFTETVMSDDEASKYVSGVAFHWYENYRAKRNDMDYLHKKYPQIFLLGTEACEEWRNHPKHVYLGSWDAFNRYADDIIKDLNHFASGWIDWNLALDLQGGPNWVQNFVDAPIIVNATSNEYYKQPMFYAMGHFSKFLVPDSIRLHFELETNLVQSIETTVFERPDKGIAMILLNQNKKPIQIMIRDPERGHFSFQSKPKSMTSFIWY